MNHPDLGIGHFQGWWNTKCKGSRLGGHLAIAEEQKKAQCSWCKGNEWMGQQS